jgi:hypothetical protein
MKLDNQITQKEKDFFENEKKIKELQDKVRQKAGEARLRQIMG